MERMIDLPGYRILEKIGEGGMATIWMARQLSLDRAVAIKVLSPRLVRDQDAIQRFRLEAMAAAKLKHPGIVQVYDAGERGGLVYIVMEYVAGCTVADLLVRKGSLQEKHTLLIAEGIALALGYAWDEARIIHCDIKPDNVLVEQDGAVKLADLGLARMIGLRGGHAEQDMVEGTPHYASPEQARGDTDLDCRTDIYSLGAMLYHLTTGTLPFRDSTGLAAMEKQVSGFLPDPRQINPGVSDGMAALIERMMVKDRALRYQTWAEVRADLEVVKRGGVPAGAPIAPQQSTVVRSGARAGAIFKPKRRATPAVVKEEEEEKTVSLREGKVKAKAVAKQRIVLPKDLRNQVLGAGKSSADLAHALFSLMLMASAVVVGYGALAYFGYVQTRREAVQTEYWDNMLPPRSQVKTAKKPAAVRPRRQVSSAPSAPQPAQVTAPAESEKMESERANWHHPRFLKGAELFNDALAKYKEYTATKLNPGILATVEQQCRDAIANFESCRRYAPPELNMQHLIDQCYHLISDCRQSTLLVPSDHAAKPSGPVSPIVSAVTNAAPAEAPPRKTQLVLAPNWNIPEKTGDRILGDLRDLLSDQGKAGVNLSPDSSLVLFGQIYYLMPVQEAAKIIGQPLAPRKNMNCPGFPRDSFFYYSTEGNFGDGFDRLLLVTDSTDHVVAVQLVNEHPDESLWLDPQAFADKWHAYNFVQLRTRGSAKWRIGQRVQNTNRVVRIDTELVANDEYGYFGLGDSKERVSLFLPQQLVNLILFRIEKLTST
ncbi:MAG: serine/threonine-protein kinase [Verrucomicrobiota bacterium]